MSKDTVIYEVVYEGKMDEAKEKFPFISKGIHLKVVRGFSKNIAVFPKKDFFYVLTANSYSDSSTIVSIEETNSIRLLNTIVNRETYEKQYFSDEDLTKIKEFLSDNQCHFTLGN